MKKTVVVLVAVSFGLVLILGGLVLFIYLMNRTIDQTLATQVAVSKEWIEIIPDSPLTKTRQVQEIDLEIAGFRHDVNDRLPWGQVRLPDGRIIGPTIEAYDESGNKYEFRHSGFTMSRKDLVVYKPIEDINDTIRLTRVRIRSDEPFTCERLFWRDRNLK